MSDPRARRPDRNYLAKDALILLVEILRDHEPGTRVLNIGSGEAPEVTSQLRHIGCDVECIDRCPDMPDASCCDYYDFPVPQPYDAIWCSHVLEHQAEPQDFLKKLWHDTCYLGWLAITVPPMKNEIVTGHLTLWNAGLLLYHLVLAGWDCAEAKVKSYGYNCSVIVQKTVKTRLTFNDCFEVELDSIANYLPLDVDVSFDGQIKRLNWHWC